MMQDARTDAGGPNDAGSPHRRRRPQIRSRNQNENQKSEAEIKSESEIRIGTHSCGQPNIVQWQQRAVCTGIFVRLVGFCAGSGPSTRRRCARASVCAVMQDAPTDAGRPNNAGRPHRRSSTQ